MSTERTPAVSFTVSHSGDVRLTISLELDDSPRDTDSLHGVTLAESTALERELAKANRAVRRMLRGLDSQR